MESSKREIASIERNFNAQSLSRTGFVFQELKDLEFEVRSLIQDRSRQVNNAECIAVANQRLDDASERAGSNSMMAYVDIQQRVELRRFVLVYPVLTQLTRLTAQFAFEPLHLLGSYSSITNFNDILESLYNQLAFYVFNFEDFVDEVLFEMGFYQRYNNDMSLTLFRSLEETRNQFVNSTEEIRNFLVTDCN